MDVTLVLLLRFIDLIHCVNSWIILGKLDIVASAARNTSLHSDLLNEGVDLISFVGIVTLDAGVSLHHIIGFFCTCFDYLVGISLWKIYTGGGIGSGLAEGHKRKIIPIERPSKTKTITIMMVHFFFWLLRACFPSSLGTVLESSRGYLDSLSMDIP